MLGIGRRKELVGRVVRAEGGALIFDLHNDLEPEEVAALMEHINDYCKIRGWHPGQMARAYSNVTKGKRHLIPVTPAE